MKMEIFLKSSPTAQVRMLTLELLSDGRIHNRKEIIDYIRKKECEYGLEHFRPGCIAGGIQQAVNECEKIESATYRLKKGGNVNVIEEEKIYDDNGEENSFAHRALEIFADFSQRITMLSRTVDFVNANDEEIEQLNIIRSCMFSVKEWEEKFKNYTKEK